MEDDCQLELTPIYPGRQECDHRQELSHRIISTFSGSECI